jgi:hypothetical protein
MTPAMTRERGNQIENICNTIKIGLLLGIEKCFVKTQF